MPKVKELTVWVEDRPGRLGAVATALGAKKVNILAFIAPVVGGRGALSMIVDKPAAARKVFKEHGWETTEEEVVEVTLADKPGSLGHVATKLGASGVNIKYAYTGSAKGARRANTYFAVSDLKTALKALR
jgi:hypothetical protein